MKKLLTFLCAFAVVFSVCGLALAKDIQVTVNGKAVTFSPNPVSISDRVFVPMRSIFEYLGATVQWDGETKSIDASRGDTKIHLAIQDKTMTVNGSNITLDVPPQLVHNSTMVPIRAVSEAFQAAVTWDGKSATVSIVTNLAVEMSNILALVGQTKYDIDTVYGEPITDNYQSFDYSNGMTLGFGDNDGPENYSDFATCTYVGGPVSLLFPKITQSITGLELADLQGVLGQGTVEYDEMNGGYAVSFLHEEGYLSISCTATGTVTADDEFYFNLFH